MMAESQEAFEERMTQVAVAGHTMMGLAVGCSLGLFSSMAELNQPFTIQDLATKAGCKERYMQEWLNHMVVADVVDVDETGSKFVFPEHRRNALTSSDQLVPGTASPFPYVMLPHKEVLECMKKGGPNGLPFESVADAYRAYNKLPSEKEDAEFCVNHAVNNIPGLKEKLEAGITVCDVGSGGGNISIQMAKQFPNSTFVGFEVDEGQLKMSQALVQEIGLTNVTFVQQDACAIPDKWKNAFGLVVMREVFHDISFASRCAREVYKCLSDDGKLALFEFSVSSNVHVTKNDENMKMMAQILYPVSLHHCLATSMEPEGSEGLGACVGREKLLDILQGAGFTVFSSDPLTKDHWKCMIVAGR